MLSKFYVQLFVKFSHKGKICNNFWEYVENISRYGNTIKIYENLRPFEKLLGKFAAYIG